MKKTETQKVISGLEKLAFGKVNDAVVLAFSEEVPPQGLLGRMNLFNVSSVKRDKGGGVEVQFFDRQKALERLYEYARLDHEGKSAAALLEALTGTDANGV